MRVLITGGHFAPAQAVIEELKKRHATIAVAGRRHPFEGDPSESYEYATVKRENIEFFEIKAGRFQRKFSSYTFSSLFKTPHGLLRAIKIIKEFKPDVVVTFGGYIGFPIAYAAKLLNVPIVLHEQTQKAGLAASWIAKVADKVCLGFESSKKFFAQKKVEVTGNPIRAGVFKIDKTFEIPANRPVIYVTGGSAGSHFINLAIGKILLDLTSQYVVIHQTGDNKFDDLAHLSDLKEKLPHNFSQNYILKKFVEEDEIGFILKNADLVIARSGINTVCELIALGKVGLLVPLTSGQKGEQLDNAKLIERLGLGKYILESDFDSSTFLATIEQMLSNLPNYLKNAQSAQKIIASDAAQKIVDVIEKAYVEKREKANI